MSDKGTITVGYLIERLPDGHVRVDVGGVWKRSESEWRKFWVKYPTEPLYQAVVKWLDENPPKPAWHDAKPGEGWVITIASKEHRVLARHPLFPELPCVFWSNEVGTQWDSHDPAITAARLEWPLPDGDDNDD